jgi:Uma2 family endonuclease
MTQALQSRRFSLEEYIEYDNSVDFKNEFHDGEVLAMSGASQPHNRITHNLNGMLYNALRGKPCQPYNADLRVYVYAHRRSYHPDATVVCPPEEFLPEDRKRGTVTNPTVVFEVLSESTRGYCLGKKLESYVTIPSLQHYVLIEQDWASVSMLTRRADGWLRTHVAAMDQKLVIPTIGVELLLEELYRNVEFPPPTEEPSPGPDDPAVR